MTRLRLLTGLPLVLLAVVIFAIGLARIGGRTTAQNQMSFGEMLVTDERLSDAIVWYRFLSAKGDVTAGRALVAVADIADEPGVRAVALQHLVRSGHATFEEHWEAARMLAAAGGLKDALSILYNAEQRFPERADVRFLSFYGALALDAKRPDVALPLAQRLWRNSGAAQIMAILQALSPRTP